MYYYCAIAVNNSLIRLSITVLEQSFRKHIVSVRLSTRVSMSKRTPRSHLQMLVYLIFHFILPFALAIVIPKLSYQRTYINLSITRSRHIPHPIPQISLCSQFIIKKLLIPSAS